MSAGVVFGYHVGGDVDGEGGGYVGGEDLVVVTVDVSKLFFFFS